MSVDSMVLEEELDGSYEATDEEVSEYAMWLGFDLPREKQLMWIAKEGLKAQLPSQWKPCRTEEDEIYYFNFDTGESTWDHPCDDYYRKLYKEQSSKLGTQRKMPEQQQASVWSEQRRLATANKAEEAVETVPAQDSAKAADSEASECKEIVPVSSTAEENPGSGRLVVRWRSALNTGSDQKPKPDEKMKLKINENEPVPNPTTGRDQRVGSPQRAKQEQDYLKRRQEMIQQVERQMNLEKKLLHERDSKILERELDRERQFLELQDAQRRQIMEAKMKLELETDMKKQEELDSRKLKREKEFKAIVDEETDSFEVARRERLQNYRKSLLDKEIQLMQSERDQMSRRVRNAMEGYESVAVQKMKAEILEKAKDTIAETETTAFASEFQEMMERVGQKVQIEAKKLQEELKQRTENEMASLKRSLLRKRREEMSQQVEAVDAELRAEMERMETIIRDAYERKSLLRRENSGGGDDRSRASDDVASVNLVPTSDTVTNALQKAACEVLLNMVARTRPEEKCCEEKFSEIKHWMAGFEKKMRTLMVTIEDTRDSFAGYRSQSRRGSCACDGNVLMCEAFRPFCHGADDPGCSSRSSNVKISVQPRRAPPPPPCSCEYYGGTYARPGHNWKVDVETDSDAGDAGEGMSDRDRDRIRRSSSRMGRSKREKALKCRKKVKKHSVETRAVAAAGKRCTGEDPGLQQETGKGTGCCDVKVSTPVVSVDEQDQTTGNVDETARLLCLTNCSSSSYSSSSGSGSGRDGNGKKRGRLNRLRKGLFVVKGKFLKWSSSAKKKTAAGFVGGAAAARPMQARVRKSDVAKLQLECRKKLRQLPIGLRWKVAKLVRRSPHVNKAFYASAEEWPTFETESSSPDCLDDIPPV